MRARREHNERMTLAWWTSAMPRMKKYPRIERLLAREASRKPQSVDQQWAILSGMAEASKVLRKN